MTATADRIRAALQPHSLAVATLPANRSADVILDATGEVIGRAASERALSLALSAAGIEAEVLPGRVDGHAVYLVDVELPAGVTAAADGADVVVTAFSGDDRLPIVMNVAEADALLVELRRAIVVAKAAG